MSSALLLIGLGGFAIALLLITLDARLPEKTAPLVDAANATLPQLQCAQCGYPGCRPYAEAIVSGNAPINRCPPGGDETLSALATLLNKPAVELDASLAPVSKERAALIDESRCIGCALCLPACPVDAIVGAPQMLHTVITDECTGCELCLAPCPVDCISMEWRHDLARSA